MTEPAGRIVGDYVLRAPLGRGGTSEVYAAEHRLRGEPVAIKLLRLELAPDARAAQAFAAEAARTRAIDHPAVVKVLDFGRDGATGQGYLVMERVDGETLAERLGRLGRLDEDEVRGLGAAIADGMQAAHDRGIVHRDLKPANIMLRGAAPTIVDFGIARQLDGQSALATGRRVGTPAYMAPEQLTGGIIAPCVDVWALGALLFESVTGRLPFDGFADGRCPQLFEAAPRAAALAPVSAALDALLASCLEREPGRRPTSMAALAAALRAGDGAERITQDAGAVLLAPGARPAAAAPVSMSASAQVAPGVASSPARRRGILLAAGVAAACAVGAAAMWLGGAPARAPDPAAPVRAGLEVGADAGVATAAEAAANLAATEPEIAPEIEPEIEIDADADAGVAPARATTRPRPRGKPPATTSSKPKPKPGPRRARGETLD